MYRRSFVFLFLVITSFRGFSQGTDNTMIITIGGLVLIAILCIVLFIILKSSLAKKSQQFYEQSLKELKEQNNQTKRMVLLHEIMTNLPLKEKILELNGDNDQDRFEWLSSPPKESIDHNLAIKIGSEIMIINEKLTEISKVSTELRKFRKMIRILEERFNEGWYEMDETTIKYLGEVIYTRQKIKDKSRGTAYASKK